MKTNSRNLFLYEKFKLAFILKKIWLFKVYFSWNTCYLKHIQLKMNFLANIKLKWLIDQVSKTDEMDKSLYNLKPLTDNKKTKKYLLNLLNDFSKIINFQKIKIS